MVKRKLENAQTETEAVVVEGQPTRLELLTGFVEVVSERFGYFMARRITQKDMTEKTKEEAKKAREVMKTIVDNVEKLIKNPEQETAETIIAKREELKEARKVLKEVRKPFNEKMKPLAQAIKYIDNVAIPDSLKELGYAVAPRFKLSDWVEKAVEQTKKNA